MTARPPHDPSAANTCVPAQAEDIDSFGQLVAPEKLETKVNDGSPLEPCCPSPEGDLVWGTLRDIYMSNDRMLDSWFEENAPIPFDRRNDDLSSSFGSKT